MTEESRIIFNTCVYDEGTEWFVQSRRGNLDYDYIDIGWWSAEDYAGRILNWVVAWNSE